AYLRAWIAENRSQTCAFSCRLGEGWAAPLDYNLQITRYLRYSSRSGQCQVRPGFSFSLSDTDVTHMQPPHGSRSSLVPSQKTCRLTQVSLQTRTMIAGRCSPTLLSETRSLAERT